MMFVLLLALLLLVAPTAANRSYRNGLVFNIAELRVAEKLPERLTCNQQLMEFAYAEAEERASDPERSASAWIGALRARSGADVYAHAGAALLAGHGFETPEAFWEAIEASEAHRAALDDTQYEEFGIGYTVGEGQVFFLCVLFVCL